MKRVLSQLNDRAAESRLFQTFADWFSHHSLKHARRGNEEGGTWSLRQPSASLTAHSAVAAALQATRLPPQFAVAAATAITTSSIMDRKRFTMCRWNPLYSEFEQLKR